jgi:putative MATE family efflux protein
LSQVAAAAPAARFVSGPIMRHVVLMTLTGALGLMSLFVVDLADLYFLSLLNKTEVTAAIGYAGTIGFTNLSISIGIGIASVALVARQIGAGNNERAKDFATTSLLFSILLSSAYTLFIALFADGFLRLLGAEGAALEQAKRFIWTLSPGFVMLAAAVNCSFSLRALGDARRAMYITLSMAILTAIADPIFIFWFGLGMQGAAIANVIAQGFGLLIGLHGMIYVHHFLRRFSLQALRRDLSAIWGIAFPAMLTQLATPFAVAYTTYSVAPYGNEAVAASAIVGRLVPVAFGMIFSLSGSVGPIIGQNFGARQFDRVTQTLVDGLKFSAVYTLITSALLFLFRHQIADTFQASGRTKELVIFFCTFVALSWAFAGAQFVSNAACNNLGKATHSTAFNWAKATFGTIPFALVGGYYWGPEGIMGSIALGSVIFGIASVWWAFRIVNNLSRQS